MNLSNFQILLAESIDNTTRPVDYLLLSKAIQSLDVGQIRKVDTFANLPDAASNEGLLVFVQSDERVYWSTKLNSNLEIGTTPFWRDLTSFTNRALAYSWGENTFGQLGDNTTIQKTAPVPIVGNFSDWCQVSSSGFHTLGLRINGTIWAWGANGDGRLGDETTIFKSSPVLVAGEFTDWCQISNGLRHSVAIRSNGTAWSWGCNNYGQLGSGDTVSYSSPVSVVGGFTDWCQVSGAYSISLGLRSNGTLWSWGLNTDGRLGTGDTVTYSSPVSVVGGFTDWCRIQTSGSRHAVAIRSDGTAWSWGCNSFGSLGDGTTVTTSSPVSVIGGFTDWCQISAGVASNLGLRSNGTLWSWGSNAQGRLGTGDTVTYSSPVSVVGGFTDWCQISAGFRHGVALRTNGTSWAWGCNTQGQLGDGTTEDKSSPVSVIGGFTDWTYVSGGGCHTTAIRLITN
jgi:alpha-tubulin suppressor-like RCC1 family protein